MIVAKSEQQAASAGGCLFIVKRIEAQSKTSGQNGHSYRCAGRPVHPA
jgi:hypothetical protein